MGVERSLRLAPEPFSDDHLLVAGSKISGTATMPVWAAPGVRQSGQLLAPETASMRPSGSLVSVGYQRADAILDIAPGVRRRIEDRRVSETDVRVDVSTDDQDATIRQRRVTRAE